MKISIALAGNPNSGKTTLFNTLTGSNQYVGNWPGVTVEKKEGKLKKHDDVTIVDLPGVYSLSPYTLEEVVARDYLVEEKPEAILNIVDGTNIERNLYLTTQLVELGIPVVVAINMMDVVRKNGDHINLAELSKKLGCKVVEISALKGEGVLEAAEEAIKAANLNVKPIPPHSFSGPVEHAIAHIEESVVHHLPESEQRWYAIKIFERDERVLKKINLSPELASHIENDIKRAEEELDDDAESIIANERYVFITSVINSFYKRKRGNGLSISDKIDLFVTNRFLALPIFALVMFLVYYVSVTTVGTWLTDWMNDGLFGNEWGIPVYVDRAMNALDVAPWLSSLIIDGIIGGVGAVLGFVPQMFVLYLFLSFLEGCGYMSRVAFVLDKIFRKFGLSGKSFIPMLIGTGCSVPGIMASRTIESEQDRRMTVITTSFIPCGAKLPVIALISGALFGGAWWVAPSAYLMGILAVLCSGIILKKTKLFAGEPTPFVMELPNYHMPTADSLWRTTWERGWSFIKKAGTVILLSSVVLWFLQVFGFENGFGMVEDLNNSILARTGKAVAWLFAPLGWGFWQAAVSTVTGLIAKENIVGTFGVLFGFAEVAENGMEYWSAMAQYFTQASAYSFLAFNLLCAPCFAAIGAIKREMNDRKWTALALVYQTAVAYIVAFVINSLGSMAAGNGNILSILLSFAFIIVALYFMFRPEKKKA